MRIVLLAHPESWYTRDLRRAAGGGAEIQCLSFQQLTTHVHRQGEAAGGSDVLSEADAVIVRSMPPGSLEQIVFRMDVLGTVHAAGTPVWNPPRSLEIAIDKYLALSRLQAAGFPVPRTTVTQTAESALAAFHELGGDVVVKPIFGGEGRGLLRVGDEELAERAFVTLERLNAVLYVQEFVPHHGYDIRLLTIGDEVFGMRRCNSADWRTNLSRGGTPEPLQVDSELITLARTVSREFGAPILGIDLLPTRDGRTLLLEVNAVPGWRGLQMTTGIDIARKILELVVKG